jgi:eukaryotic-like serine/threonine-protein kinase
MAIQLLVTKGPHSGKLFEFDRAESFLVGRAEDSHLKFSQDDPYVSRRHLLLQCNPPRLRLIDLNSRNGVLLNGAKVSSAELKHGDTIGLGHTVLKVIIESPGEMQTWDLSPATGAAQATLDLPSQPTEMAREHADSQRTQPYSDKPLSPSGYEIRSEIGRGGMGIVYQATRLTDGLSVAIKQFKQNQQAPPKAMERFIREAKIAAAVEHENVIRLVDAGETAALGYIVMEFVDGPDLRQVVERGGPLHPKSACRVIRQALAGLAEAHERGFVHRDVKPSNILLGKTKGGKSIAKLGDFGLARAYEVSQVSGLTMQGEVGGTPHFIAPEQITHYRDVKPSADQYSIAATLYYLLSANYPFAEDKTATSMFLKILSEDPIPLRQRVPSLAPELASIISRAMHRDPNQRFPSTSAFRDALRPFAT